MLLTLVKYMIDRKVRYSTMHIAMGREGDSRQETPRRMPLVEQPERTSKCRHQLKFTFEKVKEEERNREQ